MPQMAPLMWSLLMSMFICLYLMNTIKIYFLNIKFSPQSPLVKSNYTSTFSWKW